MISEEKILSIIANELQQAEINRLDGMTSLEKSLDYYLGNPNGSEVEGRSQVVSTDVADAIEWIMPQVMKSFTQNNEIVIFDPVHQGDELQAELESEYVYEVLMKQNDGFIILHQFVKDALMQNNGILKVYYANVNKVKTADYTGITEIQLQQLLAQEGVELLEQTEYLNPLFTDTFYDVKVSVSRTRGQIYVDPVPPEDFRLNSNHNSINLDSARFTAHVVARPVSDIIEEFGLSSDEVDDLLSCNDYRKEYRFSAQGESVDFGEESEDRSQREIDIAECFMRIDVDGTGIAKLMKITVAGTNNPNRILSMEEVEGMPWVSTTAFLMSHKFKGISITDRLRQIQDQKTALWRNMMDNMYLQNNQRNIVVENQVNMDDLLVSRPGGIIRAKRPDAITPLITPQLGQDAYNMMEYLDKVRAGRTGVDPDGTTTPTNIGDRVGSQGVERLMNSKEELVGLIIRVIAETGIKPLCVKIRDLTIKHVDSVIDFRFRGVWQKIIPSGWMDRTNCTVRVGTGTGNHQAKLFALQKIMEYQSMILQDSRQTLLDQKNIYTALDDFCKFSGLNGATRYFIDPESPEGQASKVQKDASSEQIRQRDEQLQILMAKSQMELAKAEQGKAQAQMLSAQSKAETDSVKNQLQLQKQTFENQINFLKQQLEEAKTLANNAKDGAELNLRRYEIDQRAALELTKLELESNKEENENYEQNLESVS